MVSEIETISFFISPKQTLENLCQQTGRRSQQSFQFPGHISFQTLIKKNSIKTKQKMDKINRKLKVYWQIVAVVISVDEQEI